MKNIQSNKIKDQKYQKSKNLGELFRKYLYHLKIYSPFLVFKKIIIRHTKLKMWKK